MRDFLLVVPDLVLAASVADVDRQREPAASPGVGGTLRSNDRDGAIAQLRFGAAQALPRGWRAWVAQRLGRPELEALAPAAVVAAALAGGDAPPAAGGDRPPEWLATPLHLVAGLDTVHLPRDGILQLDAAESAELAASFDRVLGGGELRLRAAGPEAFLLEGLDIGPVVTADPLECLGGDLVRAQPAGAGAAALRRLMAEIEMWLHDHPLNQRRAARGAAPVRSLWLWGASAPERPAPPGGAAPPAADDGEPVAMQVHSDDAWVRAAARLAGVALAPEGRWPEAGDFDDESGTLLATARLHGAAQGELARFERQHLAPALDALQAGRIAGLTVAGADRAVRLRAGDRWRVWRPRRSWLGALGA